MPRVDGSPRNTRGKTAQGMRERTQIHDDRDMQSRTTDGKPYTGNQQYKGNGIQRSCDRCGQHVAPARLKRWKGLMQCDKCRDR